MKGGGIRLRLGYAWSGWRATWRREASFRVQACFAALALLSLVVLRPAVIWWAMVTLIVALILAFELLNSALEAAIDQLHPEIHPEIKVAKDMAAGAVLMLSVASLIVGVAMMFDRLPVVLRETGMMQ